ncbi:hypothetical protein JTB14_017814 [Gonioctena quinquepunctata]|nr:hypothetical protein JTB14_017814 [Gonioctena quinquepunctata]
MNTRSSTRKPESVDQFAQRIPRNRRKTKKYLSSDSDDESTGPLLLLTPRKGKSKAIDHELDGSVTPPKQQKSLPSIEGFRDNPSFSLERLSLKSPTKNISKKKSLINRSEISQQLDDSDHEKVTKTVFQRSSAYQSARQALHSTPPADMPGRENELEEMRSFIQSNLEDKCSGSLYISGPPGTGKTASLNIILNDEAISSEFSKVYVNCTSIKSPTAIYSKIVSGLKIKMNGKTADYLSALENYLKKKHKMILLVLDEIDQLENKNQSILYTIFEWPSRPNSQLILIGIANALDLTDRTLPRLQARCELKPKLMHFAPYSKQQIVEIFTARLKSAGVLEVFSPPAIQMLAGKVAAVSGDVRRALDIGRRVVELAEQSRKGDVLKPIENLAKELSEDEMKSVELKEVLSVLNNVYGTSQNLNETVEDSFPLQQKIIICSLLLILKKAKNKDVTVGKLHEVYQRACKKRNIQTVDQAEFAGLCSLIETRGIIRVSGKKEPRLHKVCLEWDEEEVHSALQDKQLVSMILQDDSCLGKL